jgi:lipopolysaccharide/colanic/teichoic acid biosynthesis glycosyltransferase
MPAFSMESSRPTPPWKRAIDIVCCVLALPVLALLTLGMSLLVSLFSPGPIFFRQERVGLGRRRFMCYKFRTMVVRADTDVHREHFSKLIDTNAPMQKIDAQRDSRLIVGGWILRATGLDELPQIINILKGEMSIVGPRPCIPYEAEKYLAWQMERFDTLPGLTGLWQVSGKNRTTFEQMMQLDIKYARTKSWWLDLGIIFMTVPAIVVQCGDTRRQRRLATQSTPSFATSASTAASIPQRS